jgi:eukaryotic-like serine/threonine-protein kinase
MPPTNEITTDYRNAGAKSEAPTEPIKVARVQGSGRLPTTDLQSLLHKRLRVIAFLLAAGMAMVVLLVLFSPGNPWSAVAVYCLVFAVGASLAGVLWKKSSLSLRQLRVIELVLFGTFFAFWSLVHAILYPHFRLEEPEIWFPSIMASAIALPWVFIVLLYGIFIPNTWRRCAAVVGTAAVVPLVISVTAGIANDATRGHGPELFWVPLVVWMASAAAFAIYGSHRIEVLRVEVSNTRKLGQYQLKQRLGSGGMGEVYLAEHVLLRRPCAIKLIRPDRTADSSSLVRFEREVQVTATLTHANTVQIFDYGHADDGTFYYAMEYLPGLNLEELVTRHGPLPPERAVHLLRQVLGALHEAHATGLIHRDIKPSNIISCERGGLHDVAKLLDFGLVRSHGPGAGGDNLTQEGAVTGTPAYMSPEQADGKRDIGGHSDIYSLGAVAYYLLAGQPPFVRPTLLQTLVAHACDAPMPLNQLRAETPLDLQTVVLRCLEKDPARRFPDARSLEAALAGCHAAGLWTEERAAAWWHGQAGSTDGASSVAEAVTTEAQPV